MKRKIWTFVLVILIAAVPASLIAGDVFVSFDWTGISPVPTYLRYQVDGQADGSWTAGDASASGILLNLDETASHTVYVQASYDGILYGKSSSVAIAAAASESASSSSASAESVTAEEPASSVEEPMQAAVEKTEAVSNTKSSLQSMISLDGSFVMYKTGSGHSKALAGTFSQDFFKEGKNFGMGYSLGVFWDKPLVFGVKIGPDFAFKLGKKFSLAAGAGVMGDMDVKVHDSINLSAYAEAGLRFAFTDGFAIGAKFTYVYPFKSFAL